MEQVLVSGGVKTPSMNALRKPAAMFAGKTPVIPAQSRGARRFPSEGDDMEPGAAAKVVPLGGAMVPLMKTSAKLMAWMS